MIKELFMLLCMIHVLCDFYFQTQKIAEQKKIKIAGVFFHALVYAGVAILLLLLLLPGLPWYFVILFALTHAVIDLAKYLVCNSRFLRRRKVEVKESVVFIIDQLIHMVILFFIVYSVRDEPANILYNKNFVQFFGKISLSPAIIPHWSKQKAVA